MRDFSEHQQFRQWWLIALLGVVAAAGWVPLIAELATGGDALTDPLWSLVLVGILTLILPAWLLYLRLETSVDAESVHIRFRGAFIRRSIPYSDIEHFEAVTYRPVAEFGGWGIRWRRGKIAYSVSGTGGVRLRLTSEKEVLIGSQMADEFAAAMREWVKR
jgi:hypothetical protein